MTLEKAIEEIRLMVKSLKSIYNETKADEYYAQYITAKDILWMITEGKEGN